MHMRRQQTTAAKTGQDKRSILNYTVYCNSLLSWRITLIPPPNATFRGFFNSSVLPKLQGTEKELESTFVGCMKEKLEMVDNDLEISTLTNMFGSFVKFDVHDILPTPTSFPTGKV